MSNSVADQLQQIRTGIAKARALRGMIREAPGQIRRDAAIVAYTRQVDDLMERLETLEQGGGLGLALAAVEAADT